MTDIHDNLTGLKSMDNTIIRRTEHTELLTDSDGTFGQEEEEEEEIYMEEYDVEDTASVHAEETLGIATDDDLDELDLDVVLGSSSPSAIAEDIVYVVTQEGHVGEELQEVVLEIEQEHEERTAVVEGANNANMGLLQVDIDVAPTLPVVEMVFEGTLHELFHASSAAFKASRPACQPLVRGTLLFEDDDALLKQSLLVLFKHLRKDILEAHYGADAAPHFELSMVFKDLDDLWLQEHEDAASGCSLSKLVHLYMVNSGMQGQEMLLEPFRIELKVQETFLSHLSRLEAQSLLQTQSLMDAVECEDLAEIEKADNTMLEVDLEASEEDDLLGNRVDDITPKDGNDSALLDRPPQKLPDITDGLESVHSQDVHDVSKGGEYAIAESLEGATDITIMSALTAVSAADDLSGSDLLEISPTDVDSLACYDDKAYEEDEQDGDIEDKRRELRMEIAAHARGSMSPTTRSPKRTAQELLDLLDDEFVNELSPDRNYKKPKNIV
ncbi:hypothetical protein EDD11_008269 [Mortierella claussenii]|nr:hypothetical protein EDD11_008269 [Mortierella claussenii]